MPPCETQILSPHHPFALPSPGPQRPVCPAQRPHSHWKRCVTWPHLAQGEWGMWFLDGTPTSADCSVLGKDEQDSHQVTATTATPFKQQITPTTYISLQTFNKGAIGVALAWLPLRAQTWWSLLSSVCLSEPPGHAVQCREPHATCGRPVQMEMGCACTTCSDFKAFQEGKNIKISVAYSTDTFWSDK